MSAPGTQSPPLENTAPVDPLGTTNTQGQKSSGGAKDADQRKGAFKGEDVEKSGEDAGEDISKASEIAGDSATRFESKRREEHH